MSGLTNMTQHRVKGFTIVELLIVVVVIAILAAITVVAYNGIQQRTRDSARLSAANSIVKALELYYLDNRTYPNQSSTSLDADFLPQLKPYLGQLPKDPLNNSDYYYEYRHYVSNYIFNSGTGCRSGDYLSTGFWVLAVSFELESTNPFPVGRGALATDKTRCGTTKNGTSSASRALYFSPLLEVAL